MKNESRRSYRSCLTALAPMSLQPHVLQCLNRFLPRGSFAWRESPSVVATLAMMLGMLFCSQNTLNEVASRSESHPIALAPIITGVIGALFVMIFFSAAVAALSNLYTSKDLDFWLSSPLTPQQFLTGKVWEIFVATGWMLFIFALPLYLSFGAFSHAGLAYYALTPLLTGGLLLTAVLMGILAATVCAAVIPANYGRQAFGLLAVCAIGLLFFCLQSEHLVVESTPSVLEVRNMSASYTLHFPFKPLNVLGTSIESLMHGMAEAALFSLVVVWSIAYISWFVTRSIFAALFPRTMSRFQSNQSPLRFHTHHGSRISAFLGRFIPRQSRALITKDLYSFCREITHTLQLMLLLTICVLYLYNFSRIEAPTQVGPDVLRVWDVFLILANIILGSMVVLSLAARFVFPSISLEGATLWMLQTAPITSRDIIRSKYRGWFFPCSLIAMVIFSSGACALGLEPVLVVTTLLIGVIVTHGIVSLALGLGASFARFDWEHPAQLTTSSGNLLFMILGMSLLGITSVPLGLMFGIYMLFPSALQEQTHTYLLLGTGMGSIILINGLVAWLALRRGQRALTRHLGGAQHPTAS